MALAGPAPNEPQPAPQKPIITILKMNNEFIEKNGTPVSCQNGQKCFEIETKSLTRFAYGGLSSLVVENLTGEKWNTHVRVWYTFTEGVWVNTLADGTDPWKGVCLAPGDSIVKRL